MLPEPSACLLGGLLTGAQAQTLPDRPAIASDSPTIKLSPFEVRDDSDNGYTATSALSGGRTDTPLKLTSAAISVMTSQFLQDIAATDFASASEWATNVVPLVDQSHFVGGNIAINLRNMGTSFQSRNHFMWYVPSDAYNVERYEFSRGPNGVLFGDGGAGGLATTLTKRARFDARKTSLGMWGTSYGGYRATLDQNQPLNSNFAIRLNALYEDMPTWRENTSNMRWGVTLAGAYRLTKRNQLRFELEHGGYERSMIPNYYSDQSSYWDGVTAFDGVNAPATGVSTGVQRVSSSPWMVYIPGTANNGVNNYANSYRSMGSGISLYPAAMQRTDLPNLARLPYKDWNMQPKDSKSKLHFYTYSGYLDHRFSDDFHVEVGYNRTRQIYGVHENQLRFAEHRLDLNQLLPGGAPNPNFGKAYQDLHRITGQSENTMDEVRAMANYRVETNGLKQSFSGIIGSRTDKFNSYGRSLRRTNGPNPHVGAAENIIRERRYWDQVGTTFGPPPSIPGWELEYVPTSHSRQRKTIDYLQLLSISRFFNDRLAVSFGGRHDRVLAYQETSSGMPNINGYPQLGAQIVEPGQRPVAVLGAKARTEVAPTSTNAGVVYYVFRDLGVFANYSETFSTPGSGPNYIDGRAPEISRSKGMDFGLKLELFNGKVAGSVSYYTSEQTGRATGGTGARSSEMNRIWTNLNRPDLAIIAYRDTEDIKGTGYEFDINANPTRNLRLTFNLALPEASAVNLRPGLIAYFNEHKAEWQAGANDVNNPNRTQIQNDINQIQGDINSLTPGTFFNGTYKYTSNVYATYTPSGKWRNVSVGAGANIRGKQKIGNVQVPTNQPYNYLYADAYYLVSAHATYRHRFSDKLNVRFQLNISNLLDSDKLFANNYGNYRLDGLSSNPLMQLPNNMRYPDPRKFTLSATFDF